MAVFKNINFHFMDPICSKDDSFEDCNIAQQLPKTAICAGISGLIFTRCNLTNCIPPNDAAIIECNNRQVSFCKWEVPDFKGLPDEPIDCPHVTGTKVISGVTLKTRENIVGIDIKSLPVITVAKGDGKPIAIDIVPVDNPIVVGKP